MSEKMIKISAVFKIKSGEDELLVEMVINYDAAKDSEKGMTKLELYESLKELIVHQVKGISETAEVLDATADEVKEHYEQE